MPSARRPNSDPWRPAACLDRARQAVIGFSLSFAILLAITTKENAMNRWMRTWNAMGRWVLKGEAYLADGGGHGLLLLGVAGTFVFGLVRLAH
jgi:hypothetical protein